MVNPPSLGAVGCLALVLGACNTLPELTRGLCGNGILEGEESCDLSVPTVLGDEQGLVCGGSELPEERACRLLCGDDGQVCPPGWRCKPDSGRCAYPAGELERRVGPVEPGGREQIELARLRAGAPVELMEADAVAIERRTDLLEGGLSEKLSLPGEDLTAPFALGTLPQEDFQRWVIPTRNGVLAGRLDDRGRVESALFSREDLLAGGEVDALILVDLPEPCVGSRVLVAQANPPRICIPTTAPGVNAELDCTRIDPDLEPTEEELFVVAVDVDGLPGDELLVGSRGRTSVTIFAPEVTGPGDCRAGRVNLRTVAELSLASRSTLGGAPMAADADGDGRIDVFLPGPVEGDSQEWQVALQAPVGFEAPRRDLRTLSAACPVATPPRDPGFGRRLLGVGDLSGDGIADLVTTEGVLFANSVSVGPLTLSGGLCLVSVPPTGLDYRAVLFVDADANGQLDLVEIFQEGGVIAVSRGGPLLSRSLFAIEGEAVEAAAGDFDGDGTGDVLLVGVGGDLQVWRGARVDLEDRSVERFGALPGGFRGLSSGTFTFGDAAPDARDDVLLLSRDGREVFILYGSAGGTLNAPLQPSRPSTLADARLFALGPSAVLLGALGRRDGGMLAIYPDGSAVFVPYVRALGQFRAPQLERWAWPAELIPGAAGVLRLASIDAGRLIGHLGGPSETRLGVVDLSDMSFCDLGATGESVLRIEVGDFDGNGAVDVGLVYADRGSVELRLAGDGVCGFGAPRELELPPSEGGGPRDLAATDLDLDPAEEIAVLTENGVWLFDSVDAPAREAAEFRTQEPAGLRVGDLDGDGLAELVLSSSGRLVVFGVRLSSSVLELPE